MPDQPDAQRGASNFLNRLSEEIDAAGRTPDDPVPGSTPPKPAATPEPDLDSLRATGPDPGPDPLDSLSDAANKGTPAAKATPAVPDPAPKDKPADDSDPLASFDDADKERIQQYLDERLAEELKLIGSSGGAFKRLKGENRELAGKIRELETRTADPEALKAAAEKISELESLVKVNEEANSVLRLEDTDAYKAAVTTPQREILAASDTLADRYGVDRDQLANLLGNPNRRELSDGITKLFGDDVADADKFELYDLSRRAEQTFAKRNELNANAEAAIKEAQELADKAGQRKSLEERQARAEAAKDAVSRIRDKAGFIIDIVGGDMVEAFTEAHASAPIHSLNPGDQAFARFAFDAIVPLAKKVRELETELQSANDDIIILRGTNPGGGGGSGGGGGRTPEESPTESQPSVGVATAVDRIGAALDSIL